MSMTLLASHRLRLVEWSHRDNSEGDREQLCLFWRFQEPLGWTAKRVSCAKNETIRGSGYDFVQN